MSEFVILPITRSNFQVPSRGLGADVHVLVRAVFGQGLESAVVGVGVLVLLIDEVAVEKPTDDHLFVGNEALDLGQSLALALARPARVELDGGAAFDPVLARRGGEEVVGLSFFDQRADRLFDGGGLAITGGNNEEQWEPTGRAHGTSGVDLARAAFGAALAKSSGDGADLDV
jgi:hypothetical protein